MMKKSCCIDDANITPRSSSCSMVLRSDCSHGPSRKSVVVNKEQNQVTHQKRKFFNQLIRGKLAESDSSENSSQIDSYFHSSLKKLVYKSAKTYSVLKGSLYSHCEHSETHNNSAINGNGVSARFQEQCSSSSPVDTFLNNNSISQEECTYINNNCTFEGYSEIMSRSRQFSKSVSPANALSESETEDGPLYDKARKRRSNKAVTSKLRSSVGKAESHVSNNYSNHTSTKNSASVYQAAHSSFETAQRSQIPTSNSSYHTPSNSAVYKSDFNYSSGSEASFSASPFSPSVIDISTVQYTPVDRFRWFLWRSIYLKIIRCVNFDVWLLSRLHQYKRLIILLLLLPLLAYLLYGALLSESGSKSVADLSSNVIALSSYVYSTLSSPFMYSKSTITESSSEEASCSRKFSEVLYAILLAISNFFSNFFSMIFGSLSVNNKQTYTESHTKSITNKEDLKLIAVEVFEERLKDIYSKIQESQRGHGVQAVKEDSVNKVQNDITNLRLEFQSLMESVQKLEKDVTQNSEGSYLKYSGIMEDHNIHITSINAKMKDFEEKLSALSGAMKNCCDEKWTITDFAASFDKYFLAALKNLVDGDEDKNAPYYFFNEWLRSKLATDREKLSQELKFEFEKIKAAGTKYDENSQAVMETVVQQYMESLRRNLTTVNKVEVTAGDAYSLDIVKKLVKEAIMLYDADKTGRVDYALESGGGSVLSTRCSESYAEKDGTISVLGFPLWSTHNSPRTAIQPNMQPGQCWAFKGSRGFLVIQLAYTIFPTGFTLEHIPVSLSPSGSIDSAPKEFSVWGLVSEKDNEGKILGNYSYDQEGDPLQYFSVQNTYSDPFSFVELKIHSNHGNLEYTCLYRFRVHGKQPKH